MKRLNIIYWILTGLFAAVMILSGVANAMVAEDGIKLFKDMGYPVYLLPFLGVAKILGGIAILIPGYSRLKEWAYAGLMYDLIGATYSFIALGKPAAEWSPMLIFIGLGIASYLVYHKRLKARATL